MHNLQTPPMKTKTAILIFAITYGVVGIVLLVLWLCGVDIL